MKDELQQIEKNHTWELVPRPVNKNLIGSKWVFRNKYNENGEVSWLSKKQDSISLATTEAEHIAATSCYTQVLWMKKKLKDIGVIFDEPIPIFSDNTSSINISKN